MSTLFLKRNTIYVWVASLMVAVASSLCAASIKVGDAFPEIAAFKLEGTLPARLKGQVVLVDFWASWCVPCKKSFPALNELHQRYGGKGFVIVAVNVDEQAASMKQFLKSIPAGFAVVRDVEQKLVAAVEVESMPTSFLLDANGRVRFVHVGYSGDETKEAYVHEIEELLKAKGEVP